MNCTKNLSYIKNVILEIRHFTDLEGVSVLVGSHNNSFPGLNEVCRLFDLKAKLTCRYSLMRTQQMTLQNNKTKGVINHSGSCCHNVFLWRISIALPRYFNPFSHTANLQQTTLKMSTKNMEHIYNCRNNYWKKLKTLWQMEKLLVLSNFSFCHDILKSRLL